MVAFREEYHNVRILIFRHFVESQRRVRRPNTERFVDGIVCAFLANFRGVIIDPEWKENISDYLRIIVLQCWNYPKY